MKAPRYYVPLSVARLEKIHAWCCERENDPLAAAYEGAHLAVIAIDSDKLVDRLEMSRRGTADFYPSSIVWNLEGAAFQLRDTIGRLILDVIKRERPPKLPRKGRRTDNAATPRA